MTDTPHPEALAASSEITVEQRHKDAAQSIPHSLTSETSLSYEKRVLAMLPQAFARFERTHMARPPAPSVAEAVEVIEGLLQGVHGDGYVTPAGASATRRARRFLADYARTLDSATAPAPAEGLRERAKKLSAEIMAGIRRANINRAYSDESMDEFEALTLTPMLLATLSPEGEPTDV